MRVVKSFFVVILSVLLFLSFLSMGIFGTLSNSLKLENAKPAISELAIDIVEEQVDLSEIDHNMEEIESYCENNTEYVYNSEGETFVIPCKIAIQGSDTIIKYILDAKIEGDYYQDYSCEFWKCFEEEESPIFLVSEYAKNFWENKFYFCLLVSIILAGILFFLYSKKNNLPIVTGVLLLGASIIVSSLDSIGTAILKAVMSPVSSTLSALSTDSVLSIISIFFSSANSVFLTMFIISLILIGGGILLKVFKIGFKVNKVVKKFSKKEE